MFPILEFSCLNWFWKPNQSTFIGLRDSYHNLASPTTCCTGCCGAWGAETASAGSHASALFNYTMCACNVLDVYIE